MRRKLTVAIIKDPTGYLAKCVEIDGIIGRGETMRAAYMQLHEQIDAYVAAGHAISPRPTLTFIDVEVSNTKTDHSTEAECPRCGNPADPDLSPYCSAPCKRQFREG